MEIKSKTYFVCSDVHGFYDEMMESLNMAGYRRDDESHVLVVLGDIFDRGPKPFEIYSFLREIPKERRILIKGNHEQLLKEMVERGYALQHDYHNRTYDTMFQLMGYENSDDFLFEKYREEIDLNIKPGTKEHNKFEEKWNEKLKQVFNNRLLKDILEWIDSDEWQDYLETDKYIFVHSYIPLRRFIDLEKSYQVGRIVTFKDEEYREDWRNATPTEWDDAKWGCPWKNELKGLNKTGKIIVCGHWHTSDFFNNLIYKNDKTKQLDPRVSNPIFKSDKYPGLIGLDSCTALTKTVNVFVINENEL